MTLMMIVIAFLLGVWTGVGWGAAELRQMRREREELSKRLDRVLELVGGDQ